MKKCVLLAVLFVFVLAGVNSQSWTVTPDGLRDASDASKPYVVINSDGESAESLYTKTIRYINETMKNPDSSIKSDIKNDYIRYSVFILRFIKYNNSGAKIPISATFNIEFRFKDGRVRYDISSLEMPAENLKNKFKATIKGNKWKGYPVFEDNGKLFKESAKNDIESRFNELLQDYITYLNEGTPKDDW